MAKRMRTGGRGISTHHSTANRTVARPAVSVWTPTPITLIPNSLADRRLYAPDRSIKPLGAVTRRATRIVVDRRGESIRNSIKTLQFAVPQQVSVCVKRKQRKEIIHAKGIAGSRTRKPRRNFWSRIKC